MLICTSAWLIEYVFSIDMLQHMGSSNVSEDGASERVRFDNIVYYSMDEAIEKVSTSHSLI